MPNKCWQTSTSNPNVGDYLTIDWTVTWNADMTDIMNYSSSDFSSSDDSDTILCDITRTDESNMNDAIDFAADDSCTSVTTWAGFSRMNTALFNGLALGNVDAVQGEGTTMDQCLTHAAPNTMC